MAHVTVVGWVFYQNTCAFVCTILYKNQVLLFSIWLKFIKNIIIFHTHLSCFQIIVLLEKHQHVCTGHLFLTV